MIGISFRLVASTFWLAIIALAAVITLPTLHFPLAAAAVLPISGGMTWLALGGLKSVWGL